MKKKLLVFIIFSSIILLITSKCSFLYEINDSRDMNSFYNSAKYMINGKILYKDFFEHKGPVIYFIYMLAVLFKSFRIIYILEVISATIYCYYIYKTVELYNKHAMIITIIGCMSSYLSYYMWDGGQIEEFCLPIFAYLIYNVVRYIKDNSLIYKKEFFISGILVGLIFWSKYSILIQYCIIVILFIIISKAKMIKNMIIYALLGFITISIPVLLYFIATNSVSNLIDIYFVSNLNYAQFYHDSFNYFLFRILYWINMDFIFVCILIYKIQHISKNTIQIFITIGYVLHFSSILVLKFGWGYYFLITTVWFPLILSLLTKKIVILATSLIPIISGIISFDKNTFKKTDLYKEAFSYIDGSVLVIGHDFGIYYNTDYLPDEYYWQISGNNTIRAYSSMLNNYNKYDYVVINSSTYLFDIKNYILIYNTEDEYANNSNKTNNIIYIYKKED